MFAEALLQIREFDKDHVFVSKGDHARVFCTTLAVDDGNAGESMVQDGMRVDAASAYLERKTRNIDNLNYATLHRYWGSGLDESARR